MLNKPVSFNSLYSKLKDIFVRDNKCRYHKECRYYTNNYTCNHDSEANGYCGIFKEFRDFELEVKEKVK